MLTYSYANLPDYYIQLLKDNMQGIEFNSNHFSSYVYENKSFLVLMENHFQDIDPDLRLDAILKRLTWKGVRNRMARLFIHYELYGKFGLGDEDLKHLDDILSVEDRLSAYQTEGFSRGFLLAFYFKICSLKTKMDFCPKADILDLFKYCKSRSARVDWLYILMEHYVEFFGRKKMLAILEDRLPYAHLFHLLNQDDQKRMTSALLVYGASVSEAEIFTSDNLLI